MAYIIRTIKHSNRLILAMIMLVVLGVIMPAYAGSVVYQVSKSPAGHSEFQRAEAYFNAKDFKRSVDLYERAAKKGYAAAHFRLGQMYAIGRGQLRSVIEAHKHYNLASYLGDERAVAALNVIEQTMTEDQLMSAERRARAYRQLNGL